MTEEERRLLEEELRGLKEDYRFGWGDLYSGPNPDVCPELMKRVEVIEKKLEI